MKKLLEKQVVFTATLRFIAFFSKRRGFAGLTRWLTHQAAHLNLALNRPQTANTPQQLAETWQQLMPPDGRENFKIDRVTEDTAYTEIHLHCPLRGTGNVEACHKLMHYDRTLMEKTGGQLVVLESQANSGNSFCRLAIRATSKGTQDLIPAHRQRRPQ
ncbi:MAG TPA: hypothetical protein DCR93_17990 [Cytophagales bacterium]|nr:hypothetical protein [Cytophagales bacterium]HAP61301.1 hypothetical protein [Cytophagales bacterium]